jgi:histidinol-phosphate aminotransferase
LPLRPKREVAALRTAEHGGILQYNNASLKNPILEPEKVLDFSVCTNPFMPPPGVREIMSSVAIERYPDSHSTLLRQKLSQKLEIPLENMLVGSGTTELIRIITQTYFRHRDRILVVGPTYSEYETAARLTGGVVKNYKASTNSNFSPKSEEIIAFIKQFHPRAVFVCNPNNPTGKYISRDEIETIAANLGDSLLVLDEAYVAFVEESWNSLDLIKNGNIIVLRSMTKDYGLPGLRLGYAVANPDIIDNLQSAAPPWNVNAVAQAVGIAVLEQEDYLQQSLRAVHEASRFLVDGLTGMGLIVLPSDTHYFLVKTENAGEIQGLLLDRGILVRNCSSFGLEEFVRISPRILPECIKLIETFKEIIREQSLRE